MAAPASPSLADLAAAAADARLSMLQVKAEGLTSDEAQRRLVIYGPNEPARPARSHPVALFLANFTHTLALLLWFAAGLAFAGGVPTLGVAIVAVIGVNGVFAFIEEHRAERVIATLMRRVAVRARVVRDGRETALPATELVPGDVIRLGAGDVTPADCVLLSSDAVAIDLSMLTGESAPVERVAAPSPIAAASRLRPEAVACCLPSGAGVVSGSAEAVVFATGASSTMGAIASMTAGVERGASVLERQVAGLSQLTASLAVLIGTLMLVVAATLTNVGFVTALTFSTGVIVSLVPSGFLPTLSVALAIGAVRMATRGAAVRRLSALEAIGAVTVICTDKTGTLTQNALSVVGFVCVDGTTAADSRFLRDVVLCNDAHPAGAAWEGDRIDVALMEWATRASPGVDAVRTHVARVSAVPFDARHRFMSVTGEVDGNRLEIAKGAPEQIFALAVESPRPFLSGEVEQATQRGERVLLYARDEGTGLHVTGLVRLHDPPRPEVSAAIAACRRANIRVVMLTGDHPGTALAIARMIGLADSGDVQVIDGAHLDEMSDGQLIDLLCGDAVFARTDPAQKLRITTLLRRENEIVVVTGDGINDAPALRAADVGVAMGLRGTEVAKQAADVVLADDNFATIVAAIEEGRSIKANIRRMASYVFTSNVAELVPFAVYVLFSMPLPLAVVQVLAIDLGTDLVPSMALGAEPPTPRLMEAAPEPPASPLLTRALVVRTFLLFGLIEAALGMLSFLAFYFAHGWRPFEALDTSASFLDRARSMTFLGIVSGQIGCLFAQRDGALLHRMSLRGNRWISGGLAFELALALVVVYVPGLNGVFSMAPVAPQWLLVLPAGAAAFVAADVVRRTVESSDGRL